MVIMAAKRKEDNLRYSLRILARIIARDKCNKCMVVTNEDITTNKINKLKEKAKS